MKASRKGDICAEVPGNVSCASHQEGGHPTYDEEHIREIGKVVF